MTVLLWVGGALALLLLLLFRARAAWRRFVRDEARGVLAARTDVRIVGETAEAFELAIGDSRGTLFLGNLYAGLAQGPRDEAAQRAAIREFVENALSTPAEGLGVLDLERDGPRLMPRLFPRASLAQAPDGGDLPHRDSGLPGLVVAYVLDGDKAVMYLTARHLEELKLDLEALDTRAMANLRRTFPGAVVRHAVEKASFQMIKAGDSFDATRLLLVPEHLEAGESLVALIPDRETLALTPAEAKDLDGLRKLARTPASPYTLLDQPVRVTRDGFELL
jgi:hypothetical protein